MCLDGLTVILKLSYINDCVSFVNSIGAGEAAEVRKRGVPIKNLGMWNIRSAFVPTFVHMSNMSCLNRNQIKVNKLTPDIHNRT